MMLATQTENAKLGALGIEFPQPYNAAVDLVERNLRAGRADKIAVHDVPAAQNGMEDDREDREYWRMAGVWGPKAPAGCGMAAFA